MKFLCWGADSMAFGNRSTI